jgi:hypothetical protein
MAHLLRRSLCAAVSTIALTLLVTAPSRAVNASAFISGTVTQDGHPVARLQVTATGNNLTVKTMTDAQGHFAFPPLALGTYTIEAKSGDHQGNVRVDLSGGGATIALTLVPLKEIGAVAVNAGAAGVLRGSGSDVALNRTQITEMPYNNSFSEMEIQMPGAVRGANGVVHINGDHGVINYMIDGVPLPQELNRDIGGEIDLNDLSYVDLIEGAYPAQYGMRFGSVFNMATRAGTGAAGFDGNFSYGSYGTAISTIGYHAPIAGGGGYDIALSGEGTTRGLDPPDFDSPHNDASDLNQFARFTLPGGKNNFTNITFIHSHGTFQIPNDTQFGEPAGTDDNETQEGTFLAVQFHHAVGDTGAITYGPAFKSSKIADYGDPNNDFIYGESLNVTPPPFGNGGTSSDCANAMSNPDSYLPTTCAYSLADQRTEIDYIMQADYTQNFGKHTIAAGGSYDLARILKYYAITLQPNNFLAPILTPGTPDVPTTVVDDAPNLGNTYQSYIQDSWRMSNLWEADYGLRYDFFTIKSTDFAEGFGAFSPRLKITRSWGTRANVYAYIGRFFEPFSLENVSPEAAYLLNLPLQPTLAQFDLKPERDTQLELGGHLPLGSGDLGFRVWQKNANDLIDDTQVGVTLLHQDINYVLGRLSQEALTYTQPLPRGGRAYFAFAHTVSLNSGCETQLLAPCFGSPTGFTPADHEQRYTVNGGVLLRDKRNGWFSMDGEYGSGLSSAVCPATTPGYCKETPHTIFSAEKGIAIGPKTALTFNIQNLLNDRYYVTLLNAQGNHYAAPRTFGMGVRFTP